MRRAAAEGDRSVSARDVSRVPGSLAIVLATCCRSNARPSANRKYQEFTTVGTVSHSLSRRSNEGATNGPEAPWRRRAIRPAFYRLGSFGQPPGLPEAPKSNRPFSGPAGSDRKGGTKEKSKWERLFAFEFGNFRRENRRLPSDHYGVGSGPGGVVLSIGRHSLDLQRLYLSAGQSCGVFITAFNPFGQAQGDEANETAHALLGELSGKMLHLSSRGLEPIRPAPGLPRRAISRSG